MAGSSVETIIENSEKIKAATPKKPTLVERGFKKTEPVVTWLSGGSFLARWLQVLAVLAGLGLTIGLVAGVIFVFMWVFDLISSFGVVAQVVYWVLLGSFILTLLSYSDS